MERARVPGLRGGGPTLCGVAVAVLATSPLGLPRPARGQEPEPPPSTRLRPGSELQIPLASFVVPGLGQYLHGATGTGVGYSAAALGGLLLARAGDP